MLGYANGGSPDFSGRTGSLDPVKIALPTRNKGKAYAGRTLVYEDCRRDTEVLLGRKVLE